ncbi:transcription termination factor 1 isoform X2 [Sphaeramia orbicularis]|uniref:transcription termination factor 1 isoform X2 n=1 Tax=Sphaeramia orbicularis TaxID=375764 RepID=UPI00117ED1FC|nr:transcription termination factor 1 isoform X2 [Sphaeramia orbicularis]
MTDPADCLQKKKKKKRRRSESLDEPPPVVDSRDETKEKKRRREGDEDMEVSSPAEEEVNVKKKRKRKEVQNEEERTVVEPPPVVSSPVEMKKKKRKEVQKEEERTVVEPPPVVSSPVETKKKKKRKEVQNEEERTVVEPPPVVSSPVETKKKKKRKEVQNEEERTVVESPPVVSSPVETKKKKKRKEVQKEEERTVVEPPPVVSAPVEMKKKKKKRKEVQNEEERTVIEPPPVVSSPVKMKKKKSKEVQNEEERTVVEPPPVVSAPVEIKKKKKKKRKEVQNEEERTVVELPPVVSSPVETKKKKHKEKESMAMVTTENSSVDMEEKKKKKKRKEEKRRPVVDEPLVVTSPVEKEKKKKRKEVQREEESITKVTTDNNVSMKKKKRRKMEQEDENCVVIATFQSEEKKKKQTNGLMEPSVTMATTTKDLDWEPLVPMETSKSKKKEEKKKEEEQEDCIIIGTTETEVRSITMVTTNKNPQTEHVKNQVEPVTIATAQKEQQQKNNNYNWNQHQIDGQMEPSITMETADACWEAQLQELQEFIPNLSQKSSIVISKMLLYDLPRFREFKKKGVALRWGRFSEEENEQIRANINNFLLLTGIDSVEELMFPQRFKDKEAEIKKQRINYHYMQRIAEGIPRPCVQILIRAKKMMDQRNHMGRFTDDEVHALTKLHTLHGNDWKTIAEKMNRSTASVLKRFATTGEGKGAWSEDEVARLKSAVEDHLKTRLCKSPPGSGLTGQQLSVKLPWTRISLAVGSRTWYQCRLKWFSILKHCLEGQRSTSGLGIQNRIDIINTLFNMNVREPCDFDWMEVAKAVGAVTPVYVQKAFRRMKTTGVPNWNRLSYGEIVDILRERELPRLQMKLDRLKKKQEQRDGHRRTENPVDLQKTYQLSEIFSESDS